MVEFNQAIQLNPDLAAAYNERGLVEGGLAKKGDAMDSSLDVALADYTKAIELQPDFASAYYNLGNVMQVRGEWEDAKADFTKAIELKPGQFLLAEAYHHMAVLRQQEGDKRGAQADFAHAFFYRGIWEGNKGDYGSAETDLTKAIEFNPADFQAYKFRGIVRTKLGDTSGAEADFKQAVGINPELSNSVRSVEINRKTFSVGLPAAWNENRKDDMYEPDSFVFFEGPESTLFTVTIGQKSTGISVDLLVDKERTYLSQKFTDATVTTTTNWSKFYGSGCVFEGKIGGMVRARATMFGFENGNNVCLIQEYATFNDYIKYANDFKCIRDSFTLK